MGTFHSSKLADKLKGYFLVFRHLKLQRIGIFSLLVIFVSSFISSSGIGSFIPKDALAAGSASTCQFSSAGWQWRGDKNLCVVSTYSPDQEVSSLSYYASLTDCIGKRMRSSIKLTVTDNKVAQPSAWFDNDNFFNYLGVGDLYKTGNIYPEGDTSCENIVKKAMSLWGWGNDYVQFLSDIGYSYNANNTTWTQTGDDSQRNPHFQAAVKAKVYNSFSDSLPPLTDSAKYIEALHFFVGKSSANGGLACNAQNLGVYPDLGGITGYKTLVDSRTVVSVSDAAFGNTVLKSIADGAGLYIRYDKATIIDSATRSGVQHGYVFIKGGDQNSSLPVGVYAIQAYGNPKTETCDQLLKDINTNAGAYALWLGANKAAVPTDPTRAGCKFGDIGCDKSSASSCNIPQLGWILCPVLTTGASIADSAYAFLSNNFLSTDPSLVNTDPNAVGPDGTTTIGTGTYSAWKIMQGLGNIAFVIVFLIIIFSQLTGAGITNYGVKKMLPRIVVAAILVNLSFFICQVAVDVSNILGASLKGLLEGVAAQVSTANPPPAVAGVNDTGNLGGIVVTVLAVAGGTALAWTGISAVIIAVVGAVISLITIFVLLIVRKALIVLLIVVAPLAFVAYLLPNTESLFQRWRKLLTTLLLLYPIIGLLYGACLLASTIMRGVNIGGNSTLTGIIAYIILVVPLLAIFPLLKGSLDGMGKIGGAIQSYGQKARSGAQGGVKGAANKYKNTGFGKFRTGFKADRQARIAAGTFRGTNANPLNWGRNVRARVNTGVNKNRPLNAVTGGFGADRDLAAQSQNRKDQQEAMAMFGGDNSLVSAWASTGGDLESAKKWKDAKGQGLNTGQLAQMQRMRDAGHHRKATSHLAAAQYLSESGIGDASLVNTAIARAQKSGASQTVTDGARLTAIASYRKSGRGDAVADLNTLSGTPMTQETGWGQVSASAVHRDGIDSVNNPKGAKSYNDYLNSDQENTRKALAGYDGMEERAKNDAKERIVLAAQRHQGSATGTASTITTIQDAKTYFNIK